jgi:tetratricopeptide (TPR) repeat protein
MPDRCDVCGITSLEGQRFATRHLPFQRPKLYCPSCRTRLYHRLNLQIAIVCLGFLAIGLVEVAFSHKRWLDSAGGWWPSLILLQWLLVIPHEFGHAVVARWLGYAQIRIIIGAGRPLFSFQFLGFPWLFRLIPFGGVTFLKIPGPGWRWKHLATVAAGPGINLALAGIAWLFVEPGTLFDHAGAIPKLLLFANLLVLAQSLFPYVASTPFGPVQTDGLQLWNLLFRWNKPVKQQTTRIPLWEVFLCHGLKWIIALFMSGLTLFFIVLCGVLLFRRPSYFSPGEAAFISVLDLALVALCGWYTVRVIRDPIARERQPLASGAFRLNVANAYSPAQRQLLTQVAENLERGNFAETEKACDELLASLPDSSSPAYAHVLSIKLTSLCKREAVDQVETICGEFVKQGPATMLQIHVLDMAACTILYQGTGPQLEHAERLVRLALELAPSAATLKGTLGGVLAEQGQFVEAEAILQQCLEQSDALHDQAISSFYLGVVKLATNRREEAKQLMKRALTFYPEPWFTAKVQARLKELEEQSLKAT